MAHEEERIRSLEAQVSELTNSVTCLTAGIMTLAHNLSNSFAQGNFRSNLDQVIAVAASLSGRAIPQLVPNAYGTDRPIDCQVWGNWYPYTPPPTGIPIPGVAVTQLEEGRSVWDRLMDDQIL